MDCKTIEGLISQYIENDVSEDLYKNITLHLRECPKCRSLKEKMEELIYYSQDLEENVPFYVKNRLYYISERKEEKIKRNIYLKWIAAAIGTIVLFLNLFYFTNIFPAANRTLHLMVSEIENFAVNTEAFFEKMKESGDNFFFGFFTENGELETSAKSQGSDDKGGKNG